MTVLTTKQMAAIRTRILRAQRSMSCMGEIMLHMDIDQMGADNRRDLQMYLASKGTQFAYLDQTIARLDKTPTGWATYTNDKQESA